MDEESFTLDLVENLVRVMETLRVTKCICMRPPEAQQSIGIGTQLGMSTGCIVMTYLILNLTRIYFPFNKNLLVFDCTDEHEGSDVSHIQAVPVRPSK